MRGIVSAEVGCDCEHKNPVERGMLHDVNCSGLKAYTESHNRLVDSLTAAGATLTEVETIRESVRTFDTGATRDTDEGKLDFEGFLAPGVLERYAQFMNENRVQSDGELRDSDNWQKGIPRDQYMKSMFRHFMEVWGNHRHLALGENAFADDQQETALCALMFNVMGYLFEMQQGR